MMSPGLSKGLRNIYASKTLTPTLLIQTSGSRYKIEVLAGGVDAKIVAHMKALSDRPNHFNLYPLLHNTLASNLIKPSLKSLQPDSQPIQDVMFIAIKHDTRFVDKAVITKMDREFGSIKHKKMFISNAQKNGTFCCISIKLGRTDEPDMGYLNPELSYIASYAIHRGKQIEQDIWSTVGFIQCFDVTQEILQRYKLVEDDVKAEVSNAADIA